MEGASRKGRTDEATGSVAPLKGVRVLDLSRVLAGPLCSMMLADLGAEVIKIERTNGGDETREWGPPYQGGESSYFLSLNRGKRSCALDLADTSDREVVLGLCEDADVLIENFRPGGADRLGVGFEDVRKRREGIIYCSITGFGTKRLPVDRPGYDFVAQAESGLMAATGFEQPTKVGVAIIDVIAGQQLAVALLAGLTDRERSGEAQHVEVSLLDAGISAMVNVAANSLATREEPKRWGNAHPNIVPYETFEAESGSIAVAVGNDRTFKALCRAMGLDDLSRDDRFSTNAKRILNRATLVNLLQERFRQEPAEFWVESLGTAGVPVGQIRGVLDAMRAAEDAGDPATFTINHPEAGKIELVRPAFSFNGERPVAKSAPPTLGEHTEDVRRNGWRTA